MKIKIFYDYDTDRLQYEINDFISKNDIHSIRDIKISATDNTLYAVLIFEEV